MASYWLLALVMATMAAPDPTLIGYDCTDTRSNYTVLDLTQIEECVDHADVYSQKTARVQVIQTRSYRPVHVYTCFVRVTRIVYRCGMHSHISAVPRGFHSMIHVLGREGCLGLHRERSLRYTGAVFADLAPNSTANRQMTLAGSIGESGTCYGASYSDEVGTYTNVVVQAVIEISIFDYLGVASLKEDMLIIPRTNVMCPMRNGYCLDTQQGEAAWTFTDESVCPKVEVDVLYEGQADLIGEDPERVLVVSHSGRTFAFRILRPTQVCGRVVYTTEHSMIFVSERGPLGDQWPGVDQAEMYAKNVDLTMHIGSKFLYVTQVLSQNIRSLMAAFTRNECKTRRLVLENRLILASLSPDRVSILTEGTGVYGRVLGEVMYILRCAPVPVKLRFTQTCYQEIPVMHDNRSTFLSPVTRLLVPVGREVPCKALIHPRFQIGDKWYIRTPELIRVPEPRRLNPNAEFVWDQHTLIDVALGGLYSEEQLRNLQGEMMFPAVREAVGTTVTRRMMANLHDNHLSVAGMLSVGEMTTLTDAVAARISWFFALFGHYASIIVGVYLVWRLALYLVNTALNCFILHRHGKSRWELCAGMLDACTAWLTLHRGKTAVPPRFIEAPESVGEETADYPPEKPVDPETAPLATVHYPDLAPYKSPLCVMTQPGRFRRDDFM